MRKLLIDCDPGHDDAIALLVAFVNPDFEILGITTESGNQTIEKTTKNAINVACYLGRDDVDIVKGVSEPLVKKAQICSDIHGESGLDGFTFPVYQKAPLEVNPIKFIVDKVLENDKVTLVATGPITNIALALKAEPKIKEHIEEIIFMGGSTESGNITPAAEFNVLCDPEATAIVINSGVKVKMIGLNITRQVLVKEEIIAKIEKINNSASEMFCKLMRVFNENQKKTFGIPYGPLHDPVTIVSLIDKDVVKYEYMNVTVDTSRGVSDGRTNCDFFHYSGLKENCYVGLEINVDRYWEIIEDAVRSYK